MFAQESQNLTDSTSQETLVWKDWITKNEELNRANHSLVSMDDKILIVGGCIRGYPTHLKNLVLAEPKTQTVKTVESHIEDEDSHGWKYISACFWKDNKIIVHGGNDPKAQISSTVAIVTLKDLDSENPSAHWEKVETQTQLRRREHFTYVYNDKMYAFGGTHKGGVELQEMWCLDLNTFEWSQIEFEGWQKDITVKKPRNISIFHENKAYIIPFNLFVDKLDFTIHELDLNSKTCKDIKVPSQPDIYSEHYMFCPRIINGGVYIHRGKMDRGKLWFYDLEKTSSQQWVSIETESCPIAVSTKVMWCNNQLVYILCERFWSLQLPSLPEKKKKSPIPANITKAQQVMKDFLAEAPYSDISFEVESKIIPAHKWWLCQKSKYFTNMFSSGMSEAQASIIKITDMKASTFQALLEFLYVEHVELDDTLALELLQQADKFSIPQLKKECEKYLSQNIDSENYVIVGQTAELLDVVSLRDAVIAFIAKNIKTLKQRKDFNDISDALLRESIVKFIVK